MTPDERQALREKHHNDGNDCCAFCTDGYVWAANYPCDVIRVLDAWDEADGKLTPEEQECKDEVEW